MDGYELNDLNNGYEICTKEKLESDITEKPLAEIHTLVDADSYREIYKFYRKNYIPEAAVFFAAAFAMIVYSVVSLPHYDENRSIFIFLAACVPLGIGIVLLICTYLSGSASRLRFRRKLYGEEDIYYDLLFYSDKFAFHDRCELRLTGECHFVIIPYNQINKIVVNDNSIAFAETKRYNVTVMRRDLPEWFLKWIIEKCPQAELSEHCENNKIQGD